MSNPVGDFVENAIKSLSPNDFENLITLFQNEYWGATQAIIVDGTNDGGNDLRIYAGKTPIKKCIQLTTQRNISQKVYSDLVKVNENIIKYSYSSSFEYYWSQSISEDSLNEYKEYARKNYGIDLQFYDAKTLSQIKCNCIKKFIYDLHGEEIKKNYFKVENSSKVLYDLLSIGNDSSDIKNNLINSFIVFFVFEKEEATIVEIIDSIKLKLDDSVDDGFVKDRINFLRTHKRLLTKKENRALIILSELEKEQISDFVKQADILQQGFESSFSKILDKYNLQCSSLEIIEYLKNLYKSNYQLDIDQTSNNLELDDSVHKIYLEFQKYIEKKLVDKGKSNDIILEIRDLCSRNDYINKTGATTAFTSLYKSNKLDKYLRQSDKVIYLDTPLIVFFLCHKYRETKLNIEWDDIFYKATINLIELWENGNGRIRLTTMFDYLKEAAGELQKAIKTSYFLGFDFIEDLGPTKNSFINFYRFLKENDLFETEDINDFIDFVMSLGFENTDPDNSSFIADTVNILKNHFEFFDVEIVFHKNYLDFDDLRREYEITLMTQGKKKSQTAIINDLRLIRYLADKDSHSDFDTGRYFEPYLATWDTTFYDFRKRLLKLSTSSYSFFYIYNPSRLINKISLENFRLNSEIITNDIFAYADANYNISSKVRTLIDMIAPILGNKVSKNIRLVKSLADIRHSQIIEQHNLNEGYDINKNLPVESVLIETINHFKSSDTKYSFDDFIALFCDEKYNEILIGFIQENIGKLSQSSIIDKKAFNPLESIIENIKTESKKL